VILLRTFYDSYVKSVGFWIFIFFLIHLLGIWHPPLEAAHSWRQATGLMVARNYFEGNTSFCFPMVDETNGGSGVIGMEFPILYFIQGELAHFFGFHPWLGRFINVLLSTLGLAYFYALIVRFSGERIAFYATLLLGVSCYFMYSRKVMSDTAALAVYIMGLFYFFEALRFGRWKDVVLCFGLLSLGLLLKISVLPLSTTVVFAYLYFRDKPKKTWVLTLPLISVLPAFIWYFIWNPFLAKRYGNWYNLGGNFSDGVRLFFEQPFALLRHLIFHPFFSYLAFGLILFALYRAFRKQPDLSVRVAAPFFFLLFMAYALKSGEIFLTHEYYILPLVPVLAILGAYALKEFGKYAWILLSLIALESIANQSHDFRYNTKEAYKLQLEPIAQKHIPNNALVAINGNSNPLELYFLGRKGWNLSSEVMCDVQFIHKLKTLGCRYLILNRHAIPSEFEGLCIFQNQHYAIYKL